MKPNYDNKIDLSSQILSRIETESVIPRRKLTFTILDGFFWLLWSLALLLGSVAVAVSLFVLINRNYSLHEATHDSFYTFMLEALPYLWVFVFLAAVMLAVYNLNHTKKGYRYSPAWLFGSSIILSLMGGTAFNMAGLGFSIDHEIGSLTKYYQSQEKAELAIWQQPEMGRLIGRTTEHNIEKPLPFIFLTDSIGTKWQVEINELSDEDLSILGTGKRVRILGLLSTETDQQFHACAVFPWIYDYEHTIAELSQIRNAMKKRINRHKNSGSQNDNEDYETSTTKKCLEMRMLSRIN